MIWPNTIDDYIVVSCIIYNYDVSASFCASTDVLYSSVPYTKQCSSNGETGFHLIDDLFNPN